MSKSKWEQIATACKGKEYGHVPGHQYHDVDTYISKNVRGKFKVEILETWGSAQGRDEEHGRNAVVAIDENLDSAVRIANSRAQAAGIEQSYMIQSLSQAHAEAVDAIEEDAPEMGPEDFARGVIRHNVAGK